MVYDNAKSFCWILSGNKLNLQAGNQKPTMRIKNQNIVVQPPTIFHLIGNAIAKAFGLKEKKVN